MTAVAVSRPVQKRSEAVAWHEERRWVVGFAVIVMLLTSIPYLLGYVVEGSQWRFTGFVFGVEDGNSYIAKMLSGASGAWLFRTPYTTQPQNGVLAFLPYLLLGKLVSPTGAHEQLVVIFHLFRFGAGFFEILATYQFLSLFLVNRRARQLGLALATLGGGLGWIFVIAGKGNVLGSIPLEFYSPETFGFLALYGLPHLALARAFLLWGLRVYLIGEYVPERLLKYQSRKPGIDLAGVWSGILLLVVGLAQPLTIVIGWAVIGAHLAALGISNWIKGDQWGGWLSYLRRAIWAGILSAPLVIYTVTAFATDSYLRQWAVQNRIISPNPLHYLIAYGLLIPFAVFGAPRLIHKEPTQGWLPVAWVIALPILAYLPYNLQRRLPEGGWVALVVLACAVYDRWLELPVRERRLPKQAFYLFILAFPSTLMLVGGGLLVVLKPGLPLYRPINEVKTFENLASHAKTGEVVISAYETGNALPAWAPLRVVVGHGPETANLASLQEKVTSFYQASTSDAQRLEILKETSARYVFWGPAERNLGGWNPKDAAYLTLEEQENGYAVYARNPEGD